MATSVRATAKARSDFLPFILELGGRDKHSPRISHVEIIPKRNAAYGVPSPELPRAIASSLEKLGIGELYTHQAKALELGRAGKNLVVVTGTASGKTLCYNLPVLEKMLEQDEATALYLFPTKALAQDQLRALALFASQEPSLDELVRAGTYDGDASQYARRTLRNEGNIILTNPDMLHSGILPNHAKWSRFFSNLSFIVVDEIHTYRGIFGSHVANVLRRLRRVVEHYGGKPTFILSSATIRNPGELAGRLIGEDVSLVDADGSPRGKRTVVFWNPPFIDRARMERRSSNVEAKELLTELIERETQTIVFTKARVTAELIYRYVKEELERSRGKKRSHGKSLSSLISPYRAGYLPEERREIERKLFSGELLGVISTNALELGIDVGGLDASILVGFPPTIASTWQQVGRAGRGENESLAVVVAYNDPIDQYLMRHPEYFFKQSPEAAIIQPDNPFILASHLACAAFELPLNPDDEKLFGPLAKPICRLLEEEGKLKEIDSLYYWSSAEMPRGKVNLRTISSDTFTILDSKKNNEVIGTVDAISAPEVIYPEGVYLHEGESYFVQELDLRAKVAFVEKRDLDYYTQPVIDSSIRVTSWKEKKKEGETEILVGDCTVAWKTTAFKKIKYGSLDSIGYKSLDLPEQVIDTTCLGIILPGELLSEFRNRGKNPWEGLAGIRNLLVTVLPILVMSDRADIGGVVESSNTGEPTIFIYDRYPGGLGFSEKAYAEVAGILKTCLSLVKECPCASGCPSCVGLPVLRPPTQQDPDVYGGFTIPSKEIALELLERVLGIEGSRVRGDFTCFPDALNP
ncbi:MAG: DEAD/DEAH box helicase [Candidatus Eisenbacteria bacterium]|nr:DEAD/DEAH box helicase [Candidatus Eisenbacteria bacterium]